MKKIILCIAIVALIFVTSCKKENSETETEMTIEGQKELAEALGLETAYNEAVLKLEEAQKNGDEDAQEGAEEGGTGRRQANHSVHPIRHHQSQGKEPVRV